MREFSAIDALVAQQTVQRDDVLWGIGDDAAVLAVRNNARLVVTMDTLVAGVHYPLDTDPADVGYKLLAVNLSDLAAMGAEPSWATLAMSWPSIDEYALHAFMSGFYELAQAHNVQLIGGDTTHAPVPVFTVQVHGWIPTGCQPLLRSGARAGDRIYVSGTLGDAALALQLMRSTVERSVLDSFHSLKQRLNRPTPRVQLGCALRDMASSCVDVSDGLLADLGHILQRSDVGGVVEIERLPLSPAFLSAANLGTRAYEERYAHLADVVTPSQAIALTGGDDYELCFTAPAHCAAPIAEISRCIGVPIAMIGEITVESGLRLRTQGGVLKSVLPTGYEHF